MPEGLPAAIRNLDPGRVQISGDLESGDLTASIDGRKFHEADALTDAFQRVEDFVKSPSRLLARQPVKHDRLWESFGNSQRYHERINEALIDCIGDEFVRKEPDPEAGYLVSLGLGFGIHTILLMDHLAFRNLVIIEPDPAIWWISLQILPWEGLIARLRERDGQLHIYAESDPALAADLAIQAFRSRDYALFDGSYIFPHTNSDYFQAFAPRFRDMLSTQSNSMGFFEDECVMMRHSLENLTKYDCHLMPADVRNPRNMPAMIVASGPSVDGCLKQIKAEREKAVLFSAGTGVGTVLEHGMVPDYHCEGENVTVAYDSLVALKQVDELKKVTLLAPTTIDPRVVSLFGSAILYFRDSVTPTRLFAGPGMTVTLAGPTVANLAARAALSMGFPELLLFGVDFGSAARNKHHSASSVYFTIGDAHWESGAGMSEFGMKAPGNLRKTVVTNRNFIHARAYLEMLLGMCDTHRIHNFSDGVRIAGAQPAQIREFKLKQPFFGPDQVVKAIAEDFDFHPAGSYLKPRLIDEFRTGMDQWLDQIAGICANDNLTTILEFHDACRPLLQQGQEDTEDSFDAAIRAMGSGTIFLILQSLYFLCRRVSPEKAAELVTLSRSLLSGMLHEIRSDVEKSLSVTEGAA